MEDMFALLSINYGGEDGTSDSQICDDTMFIDPGLVGLEIQEEEEEEEKSKKKRKKNRREKKNPYDNPYYDSKVSSVNPPDEPLNIIVIPHGKVYKVDGLNADPEDADVPCLKSFISKYFKVLGCCNGLLALYLHPGDFFLINPSTGKENLLQVPKEECAWYYPHTSELVFGFGHDSDTGEYKAVILSAGDHSFHVVNFKDKSCKYKTQHQLPLLIADYRSCRGVVVKGVPYWCLEVDGFLEVDASSSHLVVYFDFKAEEFRVGPNLPKKCACAILGSLDGCLVASLGCGACVEFWYLDDDFEWNLSHVSTIIPCSTLSWMSRWHEEVLVELADAYMVYEVKEQSLRILSKKLGKMLSSYPAVAYTPSSIDPNQ